MILTVTSSYKLLKKITVKEFRRLALTDFNNCFVSEGINDYPMDMSFNRAYISNLRGNKVVYLWTFIEERVVSDTSH